MDSALQGGRAPSAQHEEDDLLHFLDGLDRHIDAPCSAIDNDMRVSASELARPVLYATRSLPPFPHRDVLGEPLSRHIRNGPRSLKFDDVSEFSKYTSAVPDLDFNLGTSNFGGQQDRLVTSSLETSSSVVTQTALFRPHASDSTAQVTGSAWELGSEPPLSHASGSHPWVSVPPLQDRLVPSLLPPESVPIFSGIPLLTAEKQSQGPLAALSLQLEGGLEDEESCTSEEETPRSTRRPGGQRARKTEGWLEKNRRAQKAFRKRQKEKQQAAEQQIAELSERVTALELEKSRLQRALEGATRHGRLQRTKPVEEDSRAIALEVTGGVAPVQLTRRDMKEMSLQRLADIWKALVGSMVLCLPQAEREPKGSHAKNLESVAAEACMLMWVLVDLNPALLAAFISCNVEQPTLRRSGSPGMWLSILEQLQLSPEQQEALVATRRAMLANVGALLAERDRLATQAQGVSRIEGNGSLFAAAADLTRLVEQVQANVEAVQLCTAYYLSHAYVKIFTPLQCAHFFWRCYPCGPDLLSLMAAAAAAAAEPRAADIFLAAQCKSGGLQPSAEWRQALVQPLSSLRCTT